MTGEHTHGYRPQIVVPLPGLTSPTGLAVNATGTIYVAGSNDSGQPAIHISAPGSSDARVVRIEGLNRPCDIAVDSSGTVYVLDCGTGQYDWNGLDGKGVLTIPAGSDIATQLPFPDLESPCCMAVDNVGTVFVAEVHGRIVAAGLSWHGPHEVAWGLEAAAGIAVDAAGNLYVTAYDTPQVVKLAVESIARRHRLDPQPPAAVELPFMSLDDPTGLAVGADGSVYVCDEETALVWKLPQGWSVPIALPFRGVERPTAVAVDGAGSVFVLDEGAGHVLVLPFE